LKIAAADIGMANAGEIAALGVDAIRSGDAAFDLSAVRSCDSSAVAVILAWQREAAARGLALQLSGLPAALISLATVYGVAALLGVADEV
jgi:phospholipid transport system transporter-binding protein